LIVFKNYKTLIYRLFTLFVMSFFLMSSQAQESVDVLIYGSVKDYFSRRKLEGVQVKVSQDGTLFDSQTISGSGKYEFFLPLDHVYSLSFEKSGYVTKFFEVNAKNIPVEDLRGGFSMPSDVSLFETMENVDFSILKDPIGKAKYEPSRGGIEWDNEYTTRIQNELARLMRDVEKAVEEQSKEEDSAAQAALKLEEDYTKYMAQGNGDMTKKAYGSAVSNFTTALDLKPGDAAAKTKLGEANKKLTEENAAAERDKKYNAFMDAADAAFKAKNWQDAITNYDGALGVKAAEKYPTAQKRLAKAELDKEKAAADKESAIAKLISEGDVEVGKEAYQKGIDKFKAALVIIPAQKDATEKLANAQKLLAAYMAEADQRAAYQKLITEADGLFGKKDYKASILKYEAALAAMSDEEYPKTKIKEAQDLIAKIEAEAADAKELAEKQARFDALIKEADSAMGIKGYDMAISKLSEALTVLPDNSIAKDKLAAAQKAKADALAAADADANYLNAITDADKYFGKKEYEASIEKYREALTAKDIKYPKDQIAEAEKLIKERVAAEKESEILASEAAALAVKQAEFDGFMADGRSNFKDKTYDKAITSFEKALGVFSDNADAKKELAATKKALEDELAAMVAADREAAEKAALASKQDEYDAMMDAGETALKNKEFQAAINSFVNAASIFPGNTKGPERKAAAEKAFTDWKAQQSAAEILAQYDSFMAIARQEMSSEAYQKAIENYENALGVVAKDKDALAGIDAARKTITALGAAAEEAARMKAEEEARDNAMASEKEKMDRFNGLILQGDDAMTSETYQPAIDNYMDALSIFPEDKTAQNKLERARKTQSDALARKEGDVRRRAEEEARQAELDKLKEAEEAEASTRRKQAETDQSYLDAIQEADKSFTMKEYLVARTYYEDALSIKSGEVYPESRLDKIKLILKQSEEDEKLRAEREANDLERAAANAYNRGKDLGKSAEDGIDNRLAEERRRALEEKWAAMERDKESWKTKNQEIQRGEGSRTDEHEELLRSYSAYDKELAENESNRAADRAENMVGYKDALKGQDQRREAIHAEKRDDAEREVKDFREKSSEEQERYYGKSSTYTDHVKEMKELKESDQEIKEKGIEVSDSYADQHEQEAKSYTDYKQRKREASNKKSAELEAQVQEDKEAVQAWNERASALAKETEIAAIESEKMRQKGFKERMITLSKEKREENLEETEALETYSKAKNSMKFTPSALVDEFPQGVTEETYEEGTKSVIRRVVIVGNKAIEYYKVASRSGTYYFKNGVSISKTLWDLESDKVPE